MIWIKRFEFGKRSVSLIKGRGTHRVKCHGYKSPKFNNKFAPTDFSDYTYTIYQGSLSECNDYFNEEVGYICGMYDDLIYQVSDYKQDKDLF